MPVTRWPRVALLFLAACTPPQPPAAVTDNLPGAVSFAVHWAEPPAWRQELYAYVKVMDGRDREPLVIKGPEPYTYGETELRVDVDIPNGAQRVLVVELRESPSLDARVRYVGVSDPRDLDRLRLQPVRFDVTLRRVPCAERREDGQPRCSLQAPARSRQEQVDLALTTDTATRVQLSNDPAFPEAATWTRELTPGERDAGTLALPWHLHAGNPDLADAGTVPCNRPGPCTCTTPAGCDRPVYARLLDPAGYGWDALQAAVTWDNVRPALLAPEAADGGAREPVVPARTHPAGPVAVFLRASERLAENPTLSVVPPSPGGPVPEPLPAPFQGATDVFSVQLVPGLPLPGGTYKVQAFLRDLAGNTSDGLVDVGEFRVDAQAPVLSDPQVDSPLSVDGLPRTAPGGTVRLAFTSSKLLQGTVTAALRAGDAGNPEGACTPDVLDGGPARYTCASITAPALPRPAEEVVTLVVQGTDSVGNASNTLAVPVVLDSLGPSATVQVFPAVVLQGGSVTITAKFPEPLDPDGGPALGFRDLPAGAPVPAAAPTADSPKDGVYTWRWSPVGQVDNVVYQPFLRARDALGNAAESNAQDSFTVDTVPPRLEVRQVNGYAPDVAVVGPAGHLDVQVAVDGDAQLSAHLHVGGVEVPARECTPAAAGLSVCSWELAGAVAALAGRVSSGTVQLEALDPLGNPASANVPFTLDLDPPGATAVVSYEPGPDNPLTTVRAARRGTTVHVSVAPDEPVVVTPGVAPLLLGLGSAGLAPSGDSTDQLLRYAYQVPESAPPPNGRVDLQVDLADRAGNHAPVVVEGGVEMRDLGDPASSQLALQVDQQGVVLVRSPWGHATEEVLAGGGTVPSGSFLELAPGASGLDGRPCLDPGVFTLFPRDGGAAVELAQVRVWARPEPFALADAGFRIQEQTLLASLRPGDAECPATADGGLPWARLVQGYLNVQGAVVTGVDNAGNESTPVAIRHSEWVATPRTTSARNPNTMATVNTVSELRRSGSTLEIPVGPAPTDGSPRFAAASALPWTSVPVQGTASFSVMAQAAAQDLARDRLVLVGGYIGVAEAREWDGLTWTSRNVPGPPQLAGAAMVFDTWRQASLLFGGVAGDAPVDTTWQWDGQAWNQAAATDVQPERREGAAMAHNPRTGETCLYGGVDRTNVLQNVTPMWCWDGASWTRQTTLGADPGPRLYPSMAYLDDAQGELVLFGGARLELGGSGLAVSNLPDTFSWRGGRFQRETPLSSPPLRLGGQMAHHLQRNTVVLFGGCTRAGFTASNRPYCDVALNDTWEYANGNWTELFPQHAPPARAFGSLVYDPLRNQLVLVAGADEGDFAPFHQDIWLFKQVERNGVLEWDWVEHTVNTQEMIPRFLTTLAYDPGRQVTVLFGGNGGYNGTGILLDDTWQYDGRRWTPLQAPGAPGNPPPCGSAVLAYNPDLQRMMLLGCPLTPVVEGQPMPPLTFWTLEGNAWVPVTTAEGPLAADSRDPLMAWDAKNHVMVAVESRSATWTGKDDGAGWVWTRHATSNGPYNQDRCSGLAYNPGSPLTDPLGEQVVAFEGDSHLNHPGTLMSWNGSTWTRRASSTPWPEQVRGPGMVAVAADATGAPGAGGVGWNGLLLFGGQLLSGELAQSVWQWSNGAWRSVETARPRPPPRRYPGVAYHAASHALLVVGGDASQAFADFWVGDLAAAEQPALQFSVDMASLLVPVSRVSGLQVRVLGARTEASATGSAGGAALYLYNPSGMGGDGGAWELGRADLGSSAAGTWEAWERQDLDGGLGRYLGALDQGFNVQVRPPPQAATGAAAQVQVQDLEARVHYTLPLQD